MEELLGAIGIAFAVFLVLSAAVESVVEVIRGFTGKLLPSLKGAVSLDEALRQAQEFAPENAQLQARLNAIKLAATRIGTDVSERVGQARSILDNATGALTGAEAAQLSERLNEAASQVTTAISEYERHRILILRLLSGAIGVAIAMTARVDVFQILAETGELGFDFGRIADNAYVGEIVTGVAAASGSSYWHDKLDKVRSIKNIQQQIAGVTR